MYRSKAAREPAKLFFSDLYRFKVAISREPAELVFSQTCIDSRLPYPENQPNWFSQTCIDPALLRQQNLSETHIDSTYPNQSSQLYVLPESDWSLYSLAGVHNITYEMEPAVSSSSVETWQTTPHEGDCYSRIANPHQIAWNNYQAQPYGMLCFWSIF